jgi:hypothetical protein
VAANPPKSRRSGARGFPMVLPPGTSPDARKEAIVAVIRATGLPPRQAALSVGISSSAYYRLADGDPDFLAEMEAATAVFARRMAAVVAKAAAALGSWKAAAFWLERRLGDAYGAKLDLHVDEVPDRLAEMSDDELSAALKASAAATIEAMPADERAAFLAELTDPDARRGWAARGLPVNGLSP